MLRRHELREPRYSQIDRRYLTEYDDSGNQLTGFSVIKNWDWRDRLGTAVIGATTTIYAYDENDKRGIETPDITYHYPNDYFSQEWPINNPTRHVLLKAYPL